MGTDYYNIIPELYQSHWGLDVDHRAREIRYTPVHDFLRERLVLLMLIHYNT